MHPHLSHWTALWEFKTAPLHRLQSALQFEQYQESLPDSIFCNSTGQRFTQDAWKRFSQSSSLTAFLAALQYFLHVRHRKLGPGFISISPAKIIRINKFVPLEGLKLGNPSEHLRLPIFLVHAKLCAIPSTEVWRPTLQSGLESSSIDATEFVMAQIDATFHEGRGVESGKLKIMSVL